MNNNMYTEKKEYYDNGNLWYHYKFKNGIRHVEKKRYYYNK